METDWSSLAARLRWAIGRAPWDGRKRGLRLFQHRMETRAKELKEAGGGSLGGVHLSSIQLYVKGERQPSPLFLHHAADVLGVREAWLMAGDGQPTDEDAIEMGAAGHALTAGHAERMKQLEAAFSEGAGVRLPLRRWYVPDAPEEPALVVLLRLWKARVAQVWPRTERSRVGVDLARQIGEAVGGPLWALGIDATDVSDDFLEEHVLSMAPVLGRALDYLDPGEDE